MNSRQPINVTYNRQTNNQYHDGRSLHASRTKMIFNGPIHGYIEHVTGEGPVIAYSEVTYVEHGYGKPNLLSRTTSSVPGKHYHDNQLQLLILTLQPLLKLVFQSKKLQRNIDPKKQS